jgi:hypothetical protein
MSCLPDVQRDIHPGDTLSSDYLTTGYSVAPGYGVRWKLSISASDSGVALGSMTPYGLRSACAALTIRDILPRTAMTGTSNRWLGTNWSWLNAIATNPARPLIASTTLSTLPPSVINSSLIVAMRRPRSLKTEVPITARAAQSPSILWSEPAGTLTAGFAVSLF